MIGELITTDMQVERVHPGLTKWHLNQAGQHPWPFRPVLHHFTTADVGEAFHDHPWHFTSIVLRGSYFEEEARIWADGSHSIFKPKLRRLGDRFEVQASHIHRIVELPEGDC